MSKSSAICILALLCAAFPERGGRGERLQVPDGPIRDDILSLARANGIPAENVYCFDASKQSKRVSANVSGLFGTTRISLNDNLLNGTSPPEIRAVMAHEMGHYVLNHGIKHTVSFSLLLLGGLLFLKFCWERAAPRFAGRLGMRGIDDPAGLPLLAALFSVYMFLATPVINTIIRSAEVEADIFGLNAAREPDGMAEVILKLADYRKLEPGAVEEAILFDHPSGYNRILAAMRWKAENVKLLSDPPCGWPALSRPFPKATSECRAQPARSAMGAN